MQQHAYLLACSCFVNPKPKPYILTQLLGGAMQVMLESQGQLALAERFLHAMRAAYPEVLTSIRTKQVAQEMLHFKAEYIAELCSSGE